MSLRAHDVSVDSLARRNRPRWRLSPASQAMRPAPRSASRINTAGCLRPPGRSESAWIRTAAPRAIRSRRPNATTGPRPPGSPRRRRLATSVLRPAANLAPRRPSATTGRHPVGIRGTAGPRLPAATPSGIPAGARARLRAATRPRIRPAATAANPVANRGISVGPIKTTSRDIRRRYPGRMGRLTCPRDLPSRTVSARRTSGASRQRPCGSAAGRAQYENARATTLFAI